MAVGGQQVPSRSGLSKDTVSVVQEAGWAPGPVWTCAVNLKPIGFKARIIHPVISRYTYCAVPAHGSHSCLAKRMQGIFTTWRWSINTLKIWRNPYLWEETNNQNYIYEETENISNPASACCKHSIRIFIFAFVTSEYKD